MKRERSERVLEPAGHLWSLSVPLMLGIAVGVALLLSLRVSRLHWTWALWGAPLAYLAWPLNWQVGLTVATATTTTAGGGLYWHLQDIERGGEEARAVRNAMGPLHVVRSLAAKRRVRDRRGRSVRKGALGRLSQDRLALGRTRKGGVLGHCGEVVRLGFNSRRPEGDGS